MVCSQIKHKTKMRFYVQVHIHFSHCKIIPNFLLGPMSVTEPLCSQLQLPELGKNLDLAFPER